MSNHFKIFIITLIAAFVLTACGGSSSESVDTDTTGFWGSSTWDNATWGP